MSSVLTLAKAFFDGDVDVDAIPSTSAIRRILVATDKICDMMIIDELEDAEYVHILFDTSKKSVDFQGLQCFFFVFFGHQRRIVHTFEFWQLIQ